MRIVFSLLSCLFWCIAADSNDPFPYEGSGETENRLDERSPCGMEDSGLFRIKYPNAQVPFIFDDSFTNNERGIIMEAMEEIHQKTCVRFHEKQKSSEEDGEFIRVQTPTYFGLVIAKSGSRSCGSLIVREDLPNTQLDLGPGCFHRGIILHELMHILGFLHEYNRIDRDHYVTINWNNIKEGYEKYFQKETTVDRVHGGAPYDYYSVMHSDENLYSKNGLPTIVPKRRVKLGEHGSLSPLDVVKINRHYGCGPDYEPNEQERMRIDVTVDGQPRVGYTLVKSSLATPLEEENVMYSGDDVIMHCMYLSDSEWTAKWYQPHTLLARRQDFDSDQVNLTSTEYTNTLNGYVKNITSYTVYACHHQHFGVVKKAIKLSLMVRPAFHPVFPSKNETLLEFKFGQEANLTCNPRGLPTPQIYWYKDGELYTQGILKDQNRTLIIPRVAPEDSGKFVCRAVNRAGKAETVYHTTVLGVPKKLTTTWSISLLLVGFSLVCCLMCFGCIILKQRKNNSEQKKDLEKLYYQLMREIKAPLPTKEQSLDQKVSDLPYNKGYEVEREMLLIGKKIGEGQFGLVWTGALKRPRHPGDGETLPVAIKGPKNDMNLDDHKALADELRIMCAIGKHPNVLALVGAVTKNLTNGEFYVIVEYCELGDLKKFLEARRFSFVNELRPAETIQGDYIIPDSTKMSRYANELHQQERAEFGLFPDSSTLTTSHLLSFAMQIAQGMEYLSNLPCIHRDLAARNVLITSNFVCRIADFGLARQNKDYYKLKSRGVLLPCRWMSIEAIEQGLFTVESDVWSYGIVLYEIFTLGGRPYPAISDEDLYDKLKDGYRHPKPVYCHEEIYQLMQQCWQEETAKRPTFMQCVHFLKRHLERSSPPLLKQTEKYVLEETKQQESLTKWITDDMDYTDHTKHVGHRSTRATSPVIVVNR